MRFEHATALLDMWDAYDRGALHVHDVLSLRVKFVEALAVVMAFSRLAVARGVLTDCEGWLIDYYLKGKCPG